MRWWSAVLGANGGQVGPTRDPLFASQVDTRAIAEPFRVFKTLVPRSEQNQTRPGQTEPSTSRVLVSVASVQLWPWQLGGY